jgi:hypothetical protein
METNLPVELPEVGEESSDACTASDEILAEKKKEAGCIQSAARTDSRMAHPVAADFIGGLLVSDDDPLGVEQRQVKLSETRAARRFGEVANG